MLLPVYVARSKISSGRKLHKWNFLYYIFEQITPMTEIDYRKLRLTISGVPIDDVKGTDAKL